VDRVVVLYAGRAVEKGDVAEIFPAPRHPYTLALLRALPGRARGRLAGIPGTVPAPGEVLPGCVFAPRCAIARPHCSEAAPELRARDGPGLTACHFPEDVEPYGAPDAR
jgi:oligopeptide/dipeptide ABC transporter ATP-binding protein